MGDKITLDKPEDASDALRFNIFKDSKKTKPTNVLQPSPPQISVINKDDVIYNMQYLKRGLAVIFNHHYFDDHDLEPRVGTEKDVECLEKVLQNLDFEVVVHNDLNSSEIRNKLNHLSELDHSNHACFVLIVMSHGEDGRIHSKDRLYKPETLWMPFSGDKCKTLAGKPRMFFIQACRGKNVDPGVDVHTETDASLTPDTIPTTSDAPVMHAPYDHNKQNTVYTMPTISDILVMYASYDGFYSWRSPVDGSWFIQCLCKELEEHAKTKDLMTILVYVNRRMAVDYKTHVPKKYNLHHKKQIGSINTTFTRLLYFYPENDFQ